MVGERGGCLCLCLSFYVRLCVWRESMCVCVCVCVCVCLCLCLSLWEHSERIERVYMYIHIYMTAANYNPTGPNFWFSSTLCGKLKLAFWQNIKSLETKPISTFHKESHKISHNEVKLAFWQNIKSLETKHFVFGFIFFGVEYCWPHVLSKNQTSKACRQHYSNRK